MKCGKKKDYLKSNVENLELKTLISMVKSLLFTILGINRKLPTLFVIVSRFIMVCIPGLCSGMRQCVFKVYKLHLIMALSAKRELKDGRNI